MLLTYEISEVVQQNELHTHKHRKIEIIKKTVRYIDSSALE